MKLLVPLVAIVLAASACASGHHAGATGVSSLPTKVRTYLHTLVKSARHPTADSTVQTIAVYGPGSRRALVKADSGDIAENTPGTFYLIVQTGHFICTGCSEPANTAPPRGSVETQVWSPTAGGTDGGIEHSVPAAVSRLHRLAVVTLRWRLTPS